MKKAINLPLVSIIIPTCNRPHWLEQTVVSALNQTYQAVEVILISDGPPTNEVLRILSKYPLVYMVEQKHTGAGAARNAGLRASKGILIQFLDDDDWLEPDSVASKALVLDNNPNAGIVYSDIYLADQDGKIIGTHFTGWKRPLPQGDVFPVLIHRNFILSHAPLWRRNVLEKVGGFPERTGAEDWECLVHAAEFTSFIALDRPLGYYRLHQRNATLNFRNQRLGDGITQSYVVSSPRFARLPKHQRIRILCEYAFQQWRDGDVSLGMRFYSLAREEKQYHNYLVFLRILMFLGRPIVQWGMRIIWQIRNLYKKTSGYYFLTKKN